MDSITKQGYQGRLLSEQKEDISPDSKASINDSEENFYHPPRSRGKSKGRPKKNPEQINVESTKVKPRKQAKEEVYLIISDDDQEESSESVSEISEASSKRSGDIKAKKRGRPPKKRRGGAAAIAKIREN